MGGDRDLMQVVVALRPSRRLSGVLHRRQQQGDQHANNGDDHEQFHERKAAARSFPMAAVAFQ
jgi:hypothetical protein